MRILLSSAQRNLLILFSAGLLFWISITGFLPTLPAYIADVGATPKQVGLVMGCFAIGLLSSRTFLGQLADRHSRKIVVLIGTIVAATAPLGYMLVQSIPLLMATRAFHGISIAAFTTGYSTLVIDLAPIKRRGETIGYMTLAVPIGMAVGPALGGFLQETVGYQYLFLVAGTCGLISFILASLVQEKKRGSLEVNLAIEPQRSIREMIKTISLMVPTAVLMFVGLLFGTLVAFLPLFLRESGVDFPAGLFYTAAAMASFAVRIFVGPASDKIGRGLFITISLVCYILSMVLLASANTANGFLLAAILEGVAAGLFIPMMLALTCDRSYESERGRVTALCIGGFDLGIALGGPLLGSLAGILSYQGIFLVAAGFGVLGLVLFMTQSGKSIAYSFGFALGFSPDTYAVIITVDS